MKEFEYETKRRNACYEDLCMDSPDIVFMRRLVEIAHMIADCPDLQTPTYRQGYTLFAMELHDLGYIDDELYLLFIRAIYPEYYFHLLRTDETTQKMYLQCEYAARQAAADLHLLSSS